MCRAIVPETAKDESKISQAIAKMLEEDLTLRYENNPETKQMLIYGMGDMHLSVLAAKLKTRFGVSVRLEEPKIPYREKITKPCDVEGKHKKQNGGSGQYGHVKIRRHRGRLRAQELYPRGREGLAGCHGKGRRRIPAGAPACRAV